MRSFYALWMDRETLNGVGETLAVIGLAFALLTLSWEAEVRSLQPSGGWFTQAKRRLRHFLTRPVHQTVEGKMAAEIPGWEASGHIRVLTEVDPKAPIDEQIAALKSNDQAILSSLDFTHAEVKAARREARQGVEALRSSIDEARQVTQRDEVDAAQVETRRLRLELGGIFVALVGSVLQLLTR